MHTTARSSRTRASPHFRDCGTAGHRLTGGAVDPHIGAPNEASLTGMARRELITGAAAAAGAVAVLPGPARAQTTQKRELIVAQGGDIAFFDPHMSTSSNDIRVSFNLYDNLTSRHPDGKLYPGLATEWKLTAPTTWTFKLRPGVKFHNGDPVSSSDVKASIERTYDPAAKTRLSTVFSTIERIEAPDPGTVVFHAKKPDPLLPARLAFYGGQIVPQKYLKSVGPDTFNGKPVGTGPIRFLSGTKENKAGPGANPQHWWGRQLFKRRPQPKGSVKGRSQLTPGPFTRP